MEWDVTGVQVLNDRSLRVQFRDGATGVVSFEPSFFSGVFTPLRDVEQFRKVQVIDGFVTWASSLDLAPDAMHAEIKAKGWMVLK
jgi:hypothetical protein